MKKTSLKKRCIEFVIYKLISYIRKWIKVHNKRQLFINQKISKNYELQTNQNQETI